MFKHTHTGYVGSMHGCKLGYRSQQAAAGCGRPGQVAAGCGRPPQAAAGCGRPQQAAAGRRGRGRPWQAVAQQLHARNSLCNAGVMHYVMHYVMQ